MNHVVRVCSRTSLFNVKITKVGYLSKNWFVSTLHYTAEYAKIDDFFQIWQEKACFNNAINELEINDVFKLLDCS